MEPMLGLGLVVVGGAALISAAVSRRWVWLAGLAYLVSPLILFAVGMLWLLVTQPGAGSGLGMALFGLAAVGVLGAVPWIAACALGFALGLVVRRRLQPPLPPAVAPRADWQVAHVGPENDACAIGGVAVWAQPWRPLGLPPVTLPHPAYAHEPHRFEIYEIGEGVLRRCFAAAELSAGLWGFYEPAIPPEPYLRPAPDQAAPDRAAGKRPVAWFSLLAVAMGAAVLIALGSWATQRVAPVPPLTPMPSMPGAK